MMILNPYRFAGGAAWQIAEQWTPNTTEANWGGTTLRLRVQSSVLLACSQMRITLDSTGLPMNLAGAYVQTRAGAGDLYDYSATPLQFLFGGSAGFTTAGGVFVSDPLTFAYDGLSDLVFGFAFGGSAGSTTLRINTGGATGWSRYYKSGNDAATVNASGYTGPASTVLGMTKIEILP